MSNFFISLNILLNRFLTSMGLRRQNRRWGIVYDSVSKEPLDPVIVKLIDAGDGSVAQTSVTDMAGRYNFLAYPGKFKILVKKSNYDFPSVLSAGDRDEIYDQLYHGEFFNLSGDSDVIPFNIPMDPARTDWNQGAKKSMMSFHPYTENLLYRLSQSLFWFLLALSLLAWYTMPSLPVYCLLGFYGLVLLIVMFLPRPRWWGTASFKNGRPAFGASVELSYKQMPQITVAKAQVYADGKFFLRLDPSNYILQIKAAGELGSGKVLYHEEIKVGSEQVINRNFVI